MTASQTTATPPRASRLTAFLTDPLFGELQGADRRNSTLLAWITFVFMIGVLINVIFFSQAVHMVIAALIGVAAYGISRTRYYRIAGYLILLAATAPSFVGIFTASPEEFSRDWLMARIIWLSLPMTLGSAFLSRREVAVMGGGCFALLALMPLVVTGMDYSLIPGALGFFGILSLLVLVAMNHRNQIEQERQQELRNANARLRDSEALLERRVEERTHELKIAKEEADAARLRAEQSDQVKSQFLASMSHELRTPLNAILNFVDMTLMGIFGPITAEQTDAMQKSLDSGKHLLALINDVLDITKIHSGMMKLFLEDDVNLTEECRSVAATAQTLMTNKRLEFVFDADADLPIIRADRRRIRQVLLNLLSNAIKFTEQGSITLRVRRQDSKIVFSVIDTGPGIAAEDQAVIFEPFQQTETGIRHAGGTGLGLPISKYLVEAHGGRIWVESAPTQGATFHAEIPILIEAEKV